MESDDLFCGIHSNIPLCCVEFFTSGAWRDVRENILEKLEEPFYSEKQKAIIPYMWMNNEGQYIMCPDCIVRYLEGRFKPHKIHECPCHPEKFNDPSYIRPKQ